MCNHTSFEATGLALWSVTIKCKILGLRAEHLEKIKKDNYIVEWYNGL